MLESPASILSLRVCRALTGAAPFYQHLHITLNSLILDLNCCPCTHYIFMVFFALHQSWTHTTRVLLLCTQIVCEGSLFRFGLSAYSTTRVLLCTQTVCRASYRLFYTHNARIQILFFLFHRPVTHFNVFLPTSSNWCHGFEIVLSLASHRLLTQVCRESITHPWQTDD